MNVYELKSFLDAKEVEYELYTQEEINQRLKELELDKFSKTLEDFMGLIAYSVNELV